MSETPRLCNSRQKRVVGAGFAHVWLKDLARYIPVVYEVRCVCDVSWDAEENKPRRLKADIMYR
jgi:hypothetical protein